MPVLYGCEIWSLTWREERRPREFENRLLRRTFRPKRDNVTGELRKPHNEEINDIYSSPNIVRVIKWGIMIWAGHYHVWERGQPYTGFWWGNLRARDNLSDSGVDGIIILR